jgi:hypothetical protein
MGSALSVFNDFMTSTDSAVLTDASSIVNEATRHNYLLRRFLKGKSNSQILQGGKTIKDQIFFDEESTFEYYQPNATFTWQNPQVLTEWEINWRFAVDHMSWTDHEIELNSGGGLSKSARHKVYKNLRRVKEQRLWTSLMNGMEDALFAVPSETDMEASGGTKPYSLAAFINSETNGLFHDGSSAWTTVEGIAPATYSKWAPQITTYDALNPGTGAVTDNNQSIFAAFDAMYLKSKFTAPPTREEYFTNSSLNAQFIACSKKGITDYMQGLRNQQDQFAAPSRQDPAFLKPTYGGIELEYVSKLDTAAIYRDTAGTALVAEDGSTAPSASTALRISSPRYYWINANYINPVFHSTRYFYRHPVMTHPNQPFTHVQPIDCWTNIVCRSRQRSGLVLGVDGNVAVTH